MRSENFEINKNEVPVNNSNLDKSYKYIIKPKKTLITMAAHFRSVALYHAKKGLQ